MTLLRRSASILLLAVVPLMGGCFIHTPVRDQVVPPGTDVRVALDGRGVERLRLETGRPGRTVTGRLAALTPDSVRVRAPMLASDGQALMKGGSYELSFPVSEITEIYYRRFSAGRTVLAVGAGVAAALLAFNVKGGGEEPEPDPPAELQIRIPLVFFR